MLRKLFLAAAAAMFFFASEAQDTTKTLAISGSVDAYYRYNFAGVANNYTSFTNSQSSFELGMASLRADATAMSGKVGATVDLGFGRRAEEFSYNDGNDNVGSGPDKNGFLSLAAIKQAYVTYAPSSKVKFTMGKFATHVGYELLDAPLNRNYSMSYMFTNGPFFHTGLKADITAGPVAFMLGVTNYTDQTTATTEVKNLIAQFSGGTKNGKLKFYLNYSGFMGSDAGNNPSGLKSLNQIDLVVLGTVSSKFNIGYNGTVQSRKPVAGSSGSWIGNALYFNFDPTAKLGLTWRSELISDSKTIYYGTKSIFANTLSVNCKVGPLTIIPELRFESAQSNFYAKSNGTGTKSTASGLLAAVYKF
ncbi:outer membrane beta-barrel protein [Ferruginibacter sp.]|nr:porin [Ferruginibacter sp.]